MTAKTDWEDGDEVTAATLNSIGFDINGKAPTTNPSLTNPRVNGIYDSNGALVVYTPPATTPVNYLKAKNSPAGISPAIEADGTDTNVGMTFAIKGGGGWLFYVATGQVASLKADGPDANHSLNLRSKGTGTVQANGVQVVDLSTAQTLTNKSISGAANPITDVVATTALTATGTKDGTTYLRSDNTWAVPSGGSGGGATLPGGGTATDFLAGNETWKSLDGTVFTGETYTGDLNSVGFGYVSYVQANVTNHPGIGNAMLVTMKNEDDTARMQISYSLTGTYAVRYRLGGSWGSWLLFYAGHEAWTDITSKPTTFAPIIGSGAADAVAGNDSRLTNARTPTAHVHAAADINSGTLAIAQIPTGTSGTTVALGNDARFTDARTPTAHVHSATDINSGTLNAAQLPSAAVTLTGTQSLSAKTINPHLDLASVAVPATPALGTSRLFARTGVSGLDAVAYLNSLGVPIVLGRDVCVFAKSTSGAITKGSVVYIASATASAITVAKAQADSSMTKLPAIGIAATDIPNNNFGMVMTNGLITGIDTGGMGDGSPAYVHPTTAGLFTATRPSHPNVAQMIGVVINSATGTGGSILVCATQHNPNRNQGTNDANWSIGDGTGSGAKTVQFKNSNTGTLSWQPTGTRTLTLPDVTGTIYASGGTDVAIADGGTGVSTLPSGLLKGAGTSPITQAAAGTDFVAPGGALGTPSSGTLTNCTGLPANTGITATGTKDGTKFLRDDGSWQAVSAGGGGDVTLGGTQTLTNKTLTDPKINAIKDSNGNTVVGLPSSPVASPVNYPYLTNSSAGNAITIDAIGGDTNIDLSLRPKGSGSLKVGTTAVVLTNDSRLTDARTPTAHVHSGADITSGTVPIAQIPTGTSGSTVALGNDSRFTDARTPTAHNHSGADITTGTVAYGRLPVGTTASTVAAGDDSRMTNARTPTAHVHSGADITSGTLNAAQLPTEAVTLTGSQTLSSKTLTAPALGTPVSGTLTNCVGMPYDLSIVAAGRYTARATGLNDNPWGVRIARACQFTSVTFRCYGASGGSDIFAIYKNGSLVSGTSTTLTTGQQAIGAAGNTTTGGPWAFAAGDILTVYATTVSSSPGFGLMADIVGVTT